MVYQLELEKFSGPLNMLLNLVEDQKLSINEISLSQVADQYISHLKMVENLSKEELATFLVIAATLILIKSRSLIPGLPVSPEEEMDIVELERRLQSYKFFKHLALSLHQFQKERRHLFQREAYAGLPAIFFPPLDLQIKTLQTILHELLTSLPIKEVLPTDTMGRTVSLEEKMMELKDRINKALSFSFEEMKKGNAQKLDVIVSFLAVLELVKEGFLLIEQDRAFDTITITKPNHE